MSATLIESIELQLTEIEILRSIYSNPDEFVIEDQGLAYLIMRFISFK